MAGRGDCCGVGTSFEARRWLVLDICGTFCVSFSFGVHLFAVSINYLYMISNSFVSQLVYGGLYLPLTIMAVWSLFKAWTTDPGAVPMGARPLASNTENNRAIRRCHKCNDNYKPPRAHHDSVTGRCIVKFDHFCPWVGNAVGALNHKFFVLFVFYTLLSCLAAIFLMLIRLVHCGIVRETPSEDNPTRHLGQEYVYPECEGLFSNPLVLMLIMAAFAFLVFTCVMLVEQIEAIESNTSKIARMKLRGGQGGSELERVSNDFNEMFGGTSPETAWHWFVPLTIKFPQEMDKVVLGYEWDPTFGDEPFSENDLVAAIKRGTAPADETAQAATGLDVPPEEIDDDDGDEENQLLERDELVSSTASSGAKKRANSKTRSTKKGHQSPSYDRLST